MRFFYDAEILCEIGTLEKFHHLQELCLNGGDFNKDPLRELIENLGHNWTKLELNHVDNIGMWRILLTFQTFTSIWDRSYSNQFMITIMSWCPFMEDGDRLGSDKEGTYLSLTADLILQTDTRWSNCLSAALNSRASHSPPAHSWTTELCTGDSDPAPLCSLLQEKIFPENCLSITRPVASTPRRNWSWLFYWGTRSCSTLR